MTSAVCPVCGSEIGPAFKACPACGWLVHGEALKNLAASAKAAVEEGRFVDALSHWREALDLLPPESRQYEVVQKEAAELSLRVASTPSAQLKAAKAKPISAKASGPVGMAGAGLVILLKFKAILIALLAQGKLLLLGLGKGATLGSMVLSLGLYWTAWSWKFALGLILGIYVHEIGHVWMMQRFGMKMAAPLFIPGLGAFVQLKQRPLNRVEDSRIGIAGPVWGMVFILAVFAVYWLTHMASYGRLTHLLAWITVFNLIPIWQLDGSRAFAAFTAPARMGVLAVAGLAWAATREGLFAFLALIVYLRINEGNSAQKTDRQSYMTYLVVLILSVFLGYLTRQLS